MAGKLLWGKDDGSLERLVATGGLSALRQAGKGDDVGPVLAIYFAQKWRDPELQPNMKQKPHELAAWVEDQAYAAWKMLKPGCKAGAAAFPFMVPGALLRPLPADVRD